MHTLLCFFGAVIILFFKKFHTQQCLREITVLCIETSITNSILMTCIILLLVLLCVHSCMCRRCRDSCNNKGFVAWISTFFCLWPRIALSKTIESASRCWWFLVYWRHYMHEWITSRCLLLVILASASV